MLSSQKDCPESRSLVKRYSEGQTVGTLGPGPAHQIRCALACKGRPYECIMRDKSIHYRLDHLILLQLYYPTPPPNSAVSSKALWWLSGWSAREKETADFVIIPATLHETPAL